MATVTPQVNVASDAPEQAAPDTIPAGRVRRWMAKLGSALGEQLFFSAGSFVFNVLLARFMTADEYGAFAVAYLWFSLVLNMHDAFIVEPMSIYGAGKYGERLRDYLGYIFVGEIGFSVLAAAVLGLGALVSLLANSTLVGHALLGAALAAPALLPRWLTRQPFYILGTPHWAALGSAIYAVVVVAGVLILQVLGALTSISAFLVMGAGGLAASLILTLTLIRPHRPRIDGELTPKRIWGDHWRYGRWASSSKSLSWITTNVIPIVSPLLIGLGGTGALRALNNIMMPLYLSVSAMMGIALPSFSRAFVQGGKSRLNAYTRNIGLLITGATSLYCLASVVFGIALISMLYDGQYDSYITLAILASNAVVQVLYGIVLTLDAALRSCGGVKQSFLANLVPTMISWTAGIWLMFHYGLLGMNIGYIIAYGIVVATLAYFYQRAGRTQDVRPSEVPA